MLVEARLYDSPAGRIVVPWLLGYTEQARIVKRESRSQVSRLGVERGEEAYVAAFEQSALAGGKSKAALRSLLGAWPSKKISR